MLACEFTITKRSSSEIGMKLSISFGGGTPNQHSEAAAICDLINEVQVPGSGVSTISKGDAVRILSME